MKLIRTKKKIYLFVPYRSFGNTCEYIHAGLCAAESNSVRLEVIVPSVLGRWYIVPFNKNLSLLSHPSLDHMTLIGKCLGIGFLVFEIIRYLFNLVLQKFGLSISFPLQFTARIFNEVDWSSLDRTHTYVSLNMHGARETKYVVVHVKESDFFDRRAVNADEYVQLAKFINELERDVIFLGTQNSKIHEFCAASQNTVIDAHSPTFTEDTLTAIAHAESVICCSSGPHYTALLFGKPILAVNATQVIMEPHKENDLTLVKRFYRDGERLTFDEYCRDIGRVQCVDNNWCGIEVVEDNSIDEVISAFCVFARMNQANMNFAISEQYKGCAQNLKNMICDASVKGEFDHIYGERKQDGARYWRDRLKFNIAVDQKSYWVMRW